MRKKLVKTCLNTSNSFNVLGQNFEGYIWCENWSVTKICYIWYKICFMQYDYDFGFFRPYAVWNLSCNKKCYIWYETCRATIVFAYVMKLGGWPIILNIWYETLWVTIFRGEDPSTSHYWYIVIHVQKVSKHLYLQQSPAMKLKCPSNFNWCFCPPQCPSNLNWCFCPPQCPSNFDWCFCPPNVRQI